MDGVGSTRGPTPSTVRLADPVVLAKEEAWEVCGALALAESVLRGRGLEREASTLAAVFERLERHLVA